MINKYTLFGFAGTLVIIVLLSASLGELDTDHVPIVNGITGQKLNNNAATSAYMLIDGGKEVQKLLPKNQESGRTLLDELLITQRQVEVQNKAIVDLRYRIEQLEAMQLPSYIDQQKR